ncbi:LOW QUALITY PROTEIN: N-acetylaspartate synthetase [Bufo gargarizans]|uniref:LOW QUALITY PROTEIN: N-acetylaspartate synthetase n=1 Tax=Bufo gargarizans TaxID=30331 RepID=UPI001CF39FB8|nr:LOW QUALITY PROTEIN: N-acetylaspartate synthetase [Bufo gargarizans]
MHYIPPKMVCETGILADDHSAIAGPQKDPLIVSSSQMWPPLPVQPAPPHWCPLLPPPPPALGGAAEEGTKEQQLYIREFQPSDQETARRIFYEGIKERIPSSAFRGLKYQPLLQCIYALLTLICFVVTNSLVLACCMPIILLGMRYYYSRKIILHHLECALRTDMSDIEQYYMKQPGSCFWVAVLEGKVVGIVAARGNEEDNVVELRRMSVDSNYRGKGIAKALGRRVLEFAMLNHYSSIVLGTTAVKIAAHKLYESLGFKHVGVVEHHTVPGMTHSLLERMFFQLRYHRYCLQLREE